MILTVVLSIKLVLTCYVELLKEYFITVAWE